MKAGQLIGWRASARRMPLFAQIVLVFLVLELLVALGMLYVNGGLTTLALTIGGSL